MFEATLEQMIIDVGVGADVLQTSFKEYGFLTPYTWMSHLWEFLEDSQLRLKHDLKVPLRRAHDRFIIPAVAKYFTKSQLKAINRCRLHLQVATLSDVTTADGLALTTQAFNGIYDKHRSHYFKWPIQPRPSETDWKWWKQALTRCFTTFKGTLQQPLGAWSDSPTT